MRGARAVLARFEDYHAFEHALRQLKDSGHRHYEAFGPVNLVELEDLMPKRGSLVRVSATTFALIGLASFFFMCIASSLIFALVVGGKLPVANTPFVIVAYEGTILLSAVATFGTTIILARLARWSPPLSYDKRFSGASYGIEVRCKPRACKQVTEMLTNAGAVEVYEPEQE